MDPLALRRGFVFSLLATLVLMACHPNDHIQQLTFDDERREPLDEAVPMRFAASTLVGDEHDQRAIVLVDPTTNERDVELWVRGDGRPDISLDLDDAGSVRSVAVLSRNEEEEATELAVYPFDGDHFGKPFEKKPIQVGSEFVVAVKQGAVVFSNDLGTRARFVPADRAHTPSVTCPTPWSILDVDDNDNNIVITAVAKSAEDIFAHVALELSRQGGECTLEPLPRPESLAEPLVSLRAARLAPGEIVYAAAQPEGVSIWRTDDVDPVVLPMVAGEIEKVLVVPNATGKRQGIVVVTSSPSTAMLVRLPDENEGSGHAIVTLRGEVTPTGGRVSRAAVQVGRTTYIATNAGLLAFEADLDALSLAPVELPPNVASLEAPLGSRW